MADTQQSSKRELSQLLCDWLDSHDIPGGIQLPLWFGDHTHNYITTKPLSLVAPALKSADLGSNAASENVLL